MKHKILADLRQVHDKTQSEAAATEIKFCNDTSNRARGITPKLLSSSASCRKKFKPNVFRLTIVRNIGQVLTRLKRVALVRKTADRIRRHSPWLWKLLINRIRPYFWAYQASSLDDSEGAFFKYTATFNERQWQQKVVCNRAYSSYLINNGVMNNRPVVDPSVILERINRAL